MVKKLIFALVIILFIVIFAVQNAGQVTISFLFWDFYISLAVILMVCIFCGAIVGMLFTMISRSKKMKDKIEPGTKKNVQM
jgi:uncharacterized integral membrane protein